MKKAFIVMCSTCEYEDNTERNIAVFEKYEDADKEKTRLQDIADRLNDEWNAIVFEDRWEEGAKEQEVVRQKYVDELQDEYFKYSCIDGCVNYMIDIVPLIMGE